MHQNKEEEKKRNVIYCWRKYSAVKPQYDFSDNMDGKGFSEYQLPLCWLI